jgi:hypothetical protein
MIRTLLRRAICRSGATTRCVCGGWYNPADPASWADHKNCR